LRDLFSSSSLASAMQAAINANAVVLTASAARSQNCEIPQQEQEARLDRSSVH
jgi:hypothetical protein